MRGKEAARYASWSAAAALAVILIVVGVYLHRRRGEVSALKNAPPPVPSAVKQQSAQFTYSKTVGSRTLFTIRASRATEYKTEDRSLLEDVSITIYGRAGDRDDNVHAQECSFLPVTEMIHCQGVVQVDLRNAKPASAAKDQALHLETSDITFNRSAGTVSTPKTVALRFPGGTGQGIGLVYNTDGEDAELKSHVELRLTPKTKKNLAPATITGNALDFNRKKSQVRLAGPAKILQDGRVLRSGELELQLDSALRPQFLRATDGPEIMSKTSRGTSNLTAEKMTASFGPDGAIQNAAADGDVRGSENDETGRVRFSAGQIALDMSPSRKQPLPRELTALGDVEWDAENQGLTRRLKAPGLRVQFAPAALRSGFRIKSAETLGPGDAFSSQNGASDRVHAGKLIAAFDAAGKLAQLDGSGGAELIQKKGAAAQESTFAQNLAAAFSPQGAWQRIQARGAVKFEDGAQTGSAERATISRATNLTVLDGDAVVNDGSASTSAEQIEVDQATGTTHARGKVVSSLVDSAEKIGAPNAPGAQNQAPTMHISADELTASSATGRAIYSGHARMWQADAVVDAETITVLRADKKLQADGNVVGVFAGSPPSRANSPSNFASKPQAPVVWHFRAPRMDYSGNTGNVDLLGGAQLQSTEGAISAQRLEIQLLTVAGKQHIKTAIGTGGVRIEQSARIATAERGEYTASAGKFVLSGGKPTLTDASGNTTQGRQLTFFLANDTILVDSPNGKRTITKHRVEK